MRCLGGAFGGGVAPGAGAGGADGADLEPVLGAAGQAGDGAARGFADVALRPGSAGREGLLGDVGLDAAAEGVPERGQTIAFLLSEAKLWFDPFPFPRRKSGQMFGKMIKRFHLFLERFR